ncbi:MAG: hypothetical protein ABI947_06235 [Chloroflexota bacterium]
MAKPSYSVLHRLLVPVALLVLIALFFPLNNISGVTAFTNVAGAQITLTGYLSMIHGDPSAPTLPNHMITYLIDAQGTATELALDHKTASAFDGKQVNVQVAQGPLVKGTPLQVLSITPIGGSQPNTRTGPQMVSGSQPWVSVLCRFSDETGVTPRPQSFFTGQLGNVYPGLDHYWREQSYGTVNIQGSIATNWYNLPHPRNYYIPPGGSLNFTAAANDCTAAADVDVYFPTYVGINLMFNNLLDCCAWGGSWYLTIDGQSKSYRMTWMPPWGFNTQSVVGHEMGHGFGLPHSSGPYGQVYDSNWDIMSWGGRSCQVNDPTYGCVGTGTIAYDHDILGWIPAARKFSADVGTSTVITLERLELPGANSNYLMAKIPINGSATLYDTVEARLQVSYDQAIPADAVLITTVDPSRIEPSHVVDADNNGNANDAGAEWEVGETYVDIANQLSVSVLQKDTSSYIVKINNVPPPLTVVNTNDSGAGSFRQAILDANASVGLDIIKFNITGSGVKTIALTSALPEITEAVIIDGTSQPGYTSSPLIEVSGQNMGSLVGAKGLVISAGNSVLRGLAINRFYGGAIQLKTNGGNIIQGNYIGTNAAGTATFAGYGNGLTLDIGATGNQIGGTTAAARNVISGNDVGLLILTGNNTVQGNYIGTNATGTAALPNASVGLWISSAANNTIGGTASGAGNVISGNTSHGLIIQDVSSTGNLVQGNYIGTNAAGTAALGNGIISGGDGIQISDGSNNTIGGTTAAARNVISGNGNSSFGVGLSILNAGTSNLVQGNYIGTNITGTAGIPNYYSGVYLSGSNNTLGGTVTGAGNLIAFNGLTGVWATGSITGNRILGNSIFSNSSVGISLNSGANNSQAAPVLSAATKISTNVTLAGTLNSTANTTFRVEFFGNTACDPSGSGEGQTFMGYASVTTNGSGTGTFNPSFAIPTGELRFSATATDPAGNTSQFSQCSPPIRHLVDTIGVFRPSATTFYMRNSNTTGSADISTPFGLSIDLPVTGDWNGDGIDTIGIYRSSTGQFLLKDSNTPGAPTVYTFALGVSGDVPMAGDWNSNGKDGVGVFRPSNGLIYLKNNLTTGFADFQMVMGVPGDKPVAGDWNNDSKDSPGIYRPSSSTFYLSNQVCNCSVFADYAATLGIGGDSPFAGDWNGDGATGIGVFRPSNGLIYLKNVPTTGFADVSIVFGVPNDKPIAGHWILPPPDKNPTATPLEPTPQKVAPTFVPS